MRRSGLVQSHDGHFGFCPANSQLYRAVVKAHGVAGPAIAAVPALGRRPATG
jgi:hypothetical protein